MSADLEQLKHLIKNHDFTYTYSDDHEAYMRGVKSDNIITEMITSLSSSERVIAKRYWNQVVDENFRSEVGGLYKYPLEELEEAK